MLHFFARGLASALASRSPTVQLAQVVQGFAGAPASTAGSGSLKASGLGFRV